MENNMVSVHDLVKAYGKMTALHGISFEVGKGEVFGLLGPNGAGKTTTLECIEGMRKADGGQILVAGCNPGQDEGKLRSLLGVQLQSSSLPDNITVTEAMALICAWHKLPARMDLLHRFGLAEMKKKQYFSLSTGQKRRLHLALALANDPQVIVLDEPTAGLDVEGRTQLHDAIRELRAAGITILIATHDMAEAETLCDRIAIIIKGHIAALGTPSQITAAGNLETRITLHTANNSLLPGRDIGKTRFISESEGFGIWMCTDTAQSVMDLLSLVQQNGDAVLDLRVERPSLEERFMELVEGRKIS
jgi:ABC-2 type transport system ATP-binding protein